MDLWGFNRSALILEVKSSKIVRSNTTISATSSTRLAHSPGPFSSAHHADSHLAAYLLIRRQLLTPRFISGLWPYLSLCRVAIVRQDAGPLGKRQMLDDVWTLECDAVEEPQGADSLVELAPRDTLFDEVQLVLANLCGDQVGGRVPKMLGKLGDGMDVDLDGPG